MKVKVKNTTMNDYPLAVFQILDYQNTEVYNETHEDYPSYYLTIGDISREGGSIFWTWDANGNLVNCEKGAPNCYCHSDDKYYLADHSSHQNGLDVDMRYIATDTVPPGLVSIDDSNYDFNRTRNLLEKLIVSQIVDTIYASDQALVDMVRKVGFKENHKTHFHLRISDPDGPGNCN